MALERLSIETIQGGACLRDANAILDRIIADTLLRDGLTKERVLNLRIAIKPDVDEESDVNRPVISYKVSETLPGIKGSTTRAMVDPKTGDLLVNPADWDVPEQMGIDEAENIEKLHPGESKEA